MGDGRTADRRTLVIVDGYNVIFRLAPWAMDAGSGGLGEARQRLEEALRRHAERRGRAVWVVYDGRNTSGAHPGSLDEGRFRVTYVDPPAEADDHIVQLALQAARRGTAARVVTSDRRLEVRLAESGAEVIRVEDFDLDLAPPAPGGTRRAGDLPSQAQADLARHFESLPGWDQAQRLVEDRGSSAAAGGAAGSGGHPGGGPAAPGRSPDAEAARERRRLRGERRQKRRLSARRGRRG
jgi:predicted RNA-binding protein with PIN domain